MMKVYGINFLFSLILFLLMAADIYNVSCWEVPTERKDSLASASLIAAKISIAKKESNLFPCLAFT